VVVDGQVRLLLPVRLAVDVDRGGGVLVDVGMVHLLDCRGVGLHYLPALSIVQLHPVVLAILDLASALERLGEEFAQVVVIGRVLKAEVTDVAEVLVELLCCLLAVFGKAQEMYTYQGSCRRGP
jgi:hypothetical protein